MFPEDNDWESRCIVDEVDEDADDDPIEDDKPADFREEGLLLLGLLLVEVELIGDDLTLAIDEPNVFDFNLFWRDVLAAVAFFCEAFTPGLLLIEDLDVFGR